MRPFAHKTAILCFAGLFTACGGGKILVESTPRPTDNPSYSPPAGPSEPLAIPSAPNDWSPVSISSSLGRDLAAALREKPNIALILPRGKTSALMEEQVFQMLKAAAPESTIVVRGQAMLDNLLEERGEIPYRVTMEPAGTNILGQPTYIPKEHPLNTEWLAKRKPLKGADAVLVVRPVRVDDERLKQLRQGRKGDCESLRRAVGDAAAHASSFFDQYKREVDEHLHNAFKRHLEVAQPFWKNELAQLGEITPPATAEARCVAAYSDLVQSYGACLQGSCELSPKFYPNAGGVVGHIDNSILLPKGCPTVGMRDYAAEIRDVASRAVAEVLPSLDGDWTAEIVRFSGLEAVIQLVEDTCAPRHRRITPEDLEQARTDVSAFLSDLASARFAGNWETASGQEKIPGVGPVGRLARVRPIGKIPTQEATSLAERLRRLDRCNRGGENLLQATLVDVGTSQVVFMGIFFDEELLCENLSPDI